MLYNKIIKWQEIALKKYIKKPVCSYCKDYIQPLPKVADQTKEFTANNYIKIQI